MNCYIKDYPRPQFVRSNWKNLNGPWNFSFDDAQIGEQDKWYLNFPAGQTIQVPFTYETKLSGIQDETRHDHVWYHRTIVADAAKLMDNDYILHFEGSDFITKLWVNGQFAGSHRGGYARFSFNISNLLHDGENEITVKAEDSFDTQQPRGKQRWENESFGCWYVQTTGIWKTVWSEYVPKASLSNVKMTPDIQNYSLDLEYTIQAPDTLFGKDLVLETTVTFKDQLIAQTACSVTAPNMQLTINLDRTPGLSKKFWSPASPNLFDIEFKLYRKSQILDEVGSYFAMRQIRIDGSAILLNDSPLYQRLILDQGYWKDSHLTPPSEEALIEDIDKILQLGYNGLRKHQKTEDERFLYWCDVKGVLVWSEMAAAYDFSDYAVSEFTTEWLEIVKQNYNHPCIITWTPFNESWGVREIHLKKEQQAFTEAIYYLTKSMDPYRPVITNDGWEHTISDIITLHNYVASGQVLKSLYLNHKDEILSDVQIGHVYPTFAKGHGYKGQPILISEYGGIAFNNDDSGWGYGAKMNSEEEFIDRFDKITTAIKEIPYVCGYCYTQVSDVQQEINGLMDMDRNFKIKPEIIYEINTRKV